MARVNVRGENRNKRAGVASAWQRNGVGVAAAKATGVIIKGMWQW